VAALSSAESSCSPFSVIQYTFEEGAGVKSNIGGKSNVLA